MATVPLVSVVIPSFNSAKTILRAIRSIQNQTYQNWELIIVDDGSTDNTFELIKPLIDSMKIKVIHQQNKGAGPARNNGVKHAQGKYIAFLDADDEWSPWKLELQIEAANQIKEFGIITTESWEITVGEKQEKPFNITKPEFKKLKEYTFYDFLEKCYIQTPSVLIPQDIFLKVGGFNPKWYTGQDRDLWLRVSYSYPIYEIPIPLVKFYVYPKSLSRRFKYTNLVNRLLINEQFWPEVSNSFDIEAKINLKSYLKIFRSKLCLVEKLILTDEPKLAKIVWERFGKIFGCKRKLVFLILQFKAWLRSFKKKKRITVDNVPELIRLLKTDNSSI